MLTTLAIEDLELLLPVTLRVLAAIMVMPIFGHRGVPAVAKIVLALAMGWLIVVPGGLSVETPTDRISFLLGLGAEVLLGLLLGFAASLAFWALTMAGEVVGLQMGWGFGGTLHASFESSSVATGQFFNIAGSLIFLGIGGHRLMLVALSNTFAAAPPYALALGGAQAGRILDLTASLFTGALQLALPVVGTLMLTEVMLAFLARVLPQLNAWVFGMPLKIGVGLLALWIGLPAICMAMARWLAKAPLNMQGMVR